MVQSGNGHEPYWQQTRSICPECRRVVDAQLWFRDNQVIMSKVCPEHGAFESLVFGDAKLYSQIGRFNRPGTPAREFATQVHEGCPYDCGLCPDHRQHACLGLLEVNDACNLDCPLCCADAGTHHIHNGFQVSFEQVEFMLDRFVAAEGNPEVIQFSGGEPTLHQRILDFVELAQQKGIRYVMLNTNGIRIAHDDRFLDGLARLKPHIYLQFDGFDAETSRLLRGRADLIDIKLRALDRLADADVRVVLVTAVERDVNEHEVGRIIEFGLQHPAVFGVNFQPAFRVQRRVRSDPLSRVTIPDVLKALEAQTHGLFKKGDFVPVPCCAPTCSFVTYALLDGDRVLPLPRVLAIDRCLDYVENRTLPGLDDALVQLLSRLWSASALPGSDRTTRDVWDLVTIDRSPEIVRFLSGRFIDKSLSRLRGTHMPTRSDARCPSCHSHLPLDEHVPRDLARHIFMVNTRDFMDPWTFDLKDLTKCCIVALVPDGRLIPFCAYNSLGYREQVRHQLAGSRSPELPPARTAQVP